MSFDDNWARAIRGRAAELGINQAEIGRILGMSKQTGHRIWNGKDVPSPEQCDQLEEALLMESGELRVLCGYLPAGTNPRVERSDDGGIIVRLESAGLILPILGLVHGDHGIILVLLYITWNKSDTVSENPDIHGLLKDSPLYADALAA